MKKILTVLFVAVITAIFMAGCDDNIEIEKNTIKEFPHVTEDGHVLYQLAIEEKLIETENYPFRYTKEYILEHKNDKYEDAFEKLEKQSETTTKKTDEKTTNKTTEEKTTTKKQASLEENNNSEIVMADAAATNAEGESTTPTTTYLNLVETDELCTYYPLRDVFDFYDIKYVESKDFSTFTTEINNQVVYLKAEKNVVYYGDKLAKVTAPVVYNDCLYATENFYEYFLGLECGLTFDKTTATLDPVLKEGTTQPAELTCITCKGTGVVACPECGGDGIVGQYEILYHEDTNANWTNPAPNERRCTHCDGTGVVVCDECDGYGVIPNPLYKEPETTAEGEKETTETTSK